jgi:hypothetical protein
MLNTHKTQIIIAIIGLVGVIVSAVIAKYEIFFNSDLSDKEKYFRVSQLACFKKDVVTCTNLEYIK